MSIAETGGGGGCCNMAVSTMCAVMGLQNLSTCHHVSYITPMYKGHMHYHHYNMYRGDSGLSAESPVSLLQVGVQMVDVPI